MNNLSQNRPEFDDPEDEFSFVYLLDLLAENRLLIGVCALIFAGLAVVYLFVAKPVYEASMVVQVEESSAGAAGASLLGNVSSLFDVKSSAAAEIQLITSRLVLEPAVRNLGLEISAAPKRFPVFGDWIARGSNGLSKPGLFGYGGVLWGNEKIRVSAFDLPHSLEGKDFTVIALNNGEYAITSPDLDTALKGKVGVPEAFDTRFGKIRILIGELRSEAGGQFTLVRTPTADIVRGLQSGLAVRERVRQSDIIVTSLEGTDPVSISVMLNEIATQYLRQNVDRKSADAAQSLNFLNEKLPEMRAALEASENKLADLGTKYGVVDLTEDAKVALSQAADASQRLLTLQQERQALAARFSPSHPAVLAIDRQIADLQRYSASIQADVAQMPEQQKALLRAKMDVQVNKDLYTSLLNSAQQVALIKAGKIGTVRLVDSAVPPSLPIKPEKRTVIVSMVLAGAVFGILLAVLRKTLFTGITDPSAIERKTGLSVYATIPYSARQLLLEQNLLRESNEISLLSIDDPGDHAVESLRSLRTSLQFAMFEAKNNIVMITGATPGVGKSFVSSNFASVLASAGMRVLLIDADLRKGYINRYLGLGRSDGLSDVVSGKTSHEKAIHRSVLPNLDYLSTGAFPPNPAELLATSKLAEFLTEMSGLYDIVLVDTPPVLAAADAEIVSVHAGTMFLVARASITRLGELQESIKRLGHVGVRPNGVIFNAIKEGVGKYSYGAKYGSYRYVSYNYRPGSSGDN